MDGYLLWRLGGPGSFCTSVYGERDGLAGKDCYDFDGHGSRVKVDVVLKEGSYTKTRCYNTESREK